MLFIPSYWWHAVYHLGDVNMNVNFWWIPGEYKLSRTSFRAFFLDLFYKALMNGRHVGSPEELESRMKSLDAKTLAFVQAIESNISRLYNI